MDGPRRAKGATLEVRRDWQRTRLQRQLLADAYAVVVPVVRHVAGVRRVPGVKGEVPALAPADAGPGSAKVAGGSR